MIDIPEPAESFAVVFKIHPATIQSCKDHSFSLKCGHISSPVYCAMFIFHLLFKTTRLPENKEQILALHMHILHQKEKQSPAWPLWKVCLLSSGWVSMGMRGWRQNAACSVCYIIPPGESRQHLIVRSINISA